MSTYNFDKVVDRTTTNTYKYGNLKNYFGRDDLLPLWVADMDFETPEFITAELKKRIEHSLFGYTLMPDGYWETIAEWVKSHHGWEVDTGWMTYVPGIVRGIGFAVNVFVKPDEKVIIQPPVYHPFRLTPMGNNREVVMNPLIETADGLYRMDFEGLEALIAREPKCRMLILSNPHNPGGVVWDANTLKTLAHICKKNNIIVISDEIHCDMTLWGNKHIPFASVSEEAASCSITFGAPSKTFNIAGIVSSYAIVPNEEIRKPFYSWMNANECDWPNMFSPIATMAAFRNGEEWRKEMLGYVEENILFVEDYLKANIPQIKAVRPQASFLVWLDCRSLNLNHDDLLDLFINKARLALNDGEMFGAEGAGHMRMNVGAPRSILAEALNRLKEAVG